MLLGQLHCSLISFGQKVIAQNCKVQLSSQKVVLLLGVKASASASIRINQNQLESIRVNQQQSVAISLSIKRQSKYIGINVEHYICIGINVQILNNKVLAIVCEGHTVFFGCRIIILLNCISIQPGSQCH